LKCSIRNCTSKVVQDELCRVHWTEKVHKSHLDNSNMHDLGIFRYAKDCLSEYMPNETPEFHKKFMLDLLRLHDPRHRNRMERLLNLINYRGSAKSTLVDMIYVSYLCAYNGKKMKIVDEQGEVQECLINEGLIVIISETATSAEDFVVRIRNEFTQNPMMVYLYKASIEDAMDNITGAWTQSAFRINGTFVQAVGTGQQIRGKIKGASRITTLIADDIYSEKNVLTEDSRAKITKWWTRATTNSVDDLKGKIILVNTIVHEDTINVQAKNNKLWKTIEYSVMPIEKFKKLVNEHTKLNRSTGDCLLPFDEIKDSRERRDKQYEYFKQLQDKEDWELAWKERQDLYFLILKYQEAALNSELGALYQEYFNITVPEETKKFRPEYFQKAEGINVFWRHGYNWIEGGIFKEPELITIEFGIDMAAGTKDGDDTVITVAGITSSRKVFVLHQFIGKTSLRDVLPDFHHINKISLDRTFADKIGLIDETFRLALKYRPLKIKFGIAGEEIAVLEEMRNIFAKNGISSQIVPRLQSAQGGKKYDRIINTCLPYYETMSVWHRAGLIKLENQLEFLGATKNDDAADSLEVALWQLQLPSTASLSWFEPKKDSKYRIPEELVKFDWRVG